ncbi:MAG: IS5 family transposase [Terracidiphilus sp.]
MADLSDFQWEYVRPFVEWDQQRRQRPDGRGGRWGDARPALNGVLWILRTGAPWQDLPARYGAYQTCHRRFQHWQRAGVLDGILWALCEDLLARGQLGLDETFVDASFSGAKRGANRIGPTRCGKGSKIMAIVDRGGLPIAVGVTSASPNESTLVDQTLDRRHVSALPKRVIGDKGYDSDPLDGRMRDRGIEMIAPNRRQRGKTQDGRPLRRYIRRWKIERLFAWLKNFRRISSRWERNALNFLGMVQLGCVLILLRHL